MSSVSNYILGIDPGLERTGYAVIDATMRRVIDAGLVRTDRECGLARRLAEIHAGLAEVLDEHVVSLVAVEDLYAHYKHPRTAILMGHARGVVLLLAAQRGLAVKSLPATLIKKTMTGSGRASKQQIQRAMMATLGLARLPEPPDVADAMAIGLSAALAMREVDAVRENRVSAKRAQPHRGVLAAAQGIALGDDVELPKSPERAR